MSQKILKMLIVNQPINNRGDEAAHKALLRTILNTFPNVKIQVLFIERYQDNINQFEIYHPQVSYINVSSIKGRKRAIYFKLLKLCMPLLRIHPTVRKVIPIYKNADFVLCAPGGICLGGFQNWEHIFLLYIAKIFKKPIAYYGRSIGPFPTKTFSNKIFKKRSIELLNYFFFISLREAKSEKIADTMNLKYVSTVDSAFLDSPCVEIPIGISKMIGKKPYIVFVPNLLIWHFAYSRVSRDEILSFYQKILKLLEDKYPNHNIVMLPQTFNFENNSGRDIVFFYELKQFTQCQKLIIIPDVYSSDIQQTIISKSDCMIGARYHSVIFAINQAVPFVALSYEHKVSGLLEKLNKTDSMVDISTAFDSEENKQLVFKQFIKVLSFAHKDVTVQKKAKNIAQEGFNKFYKELGEFFYAKG